ncbi:YSIRK-type signal peptide-containing protein, partial [Staphylococcus equorum]|uniref:YSIRK-type signal peptide-containing protein n=1 Tax=Staphylococcus equorum TaxID=246432 RepID=UPI0025550FA8
MRRNIKNQKFSIRKFKIGIGSVVIGAVFFISQNSVADADTIKSAEEGFNEVSNRVTENESNEIADSTNGKQEDMAKESNENADSTNGKQEDMAKESNEIADSTNGKQEDMAKESNEIADSTNGKQEDMA